MTIAVQVTRIKKKSENATIIGETTNFVSKPIVVSSQVKWEDFKEVSHNS